MNRALINNIYDMRKSGILLHISSLPSHFGIGDFGPEAYALIDQLHDAGFGTWQILPLNPIDQNNSPYQSTSVFAGEKLFISAELLYQWNLISKEDLDKSFAKVDSSINYQQVKTNKEILIQKAYECFLNSENHPLNAEYHAFLNEHGWWLNDYALFLSIKAEYPENCWNEWPEELRLKYEDAIQEYRNSVYERHRFTQFLFYRQWFMLKNYANSKQIEVFGDMPLYVSLDSADVWSNQNQFQLNDQGKPLAVGGVPPDYFNADGQLWGNPLYNWDAMETSDFSWWMARIHFNLHIYNTIRIDHFRGLESYWSIPADAITAKKGLWIKAKGREMLRLFRTHRATMNIIAEDLGIITSEVEQLRDEFGMPGMSVIQFAFDGDPTNPHLPHNKGTNGVVYTGTHDNNTTRGWWEESSKTERQSILPYFNKDRNIIHQSIEMAWRSSMDLAIVPIQDLLNLGAKSRMNTPGTVSGNWEWKMSSRTQSEDWEYIKNLNKIYNRFNS